jgi:hypothetical protein
MRALLASAIAARADLLIADNLDHLAIKDAERVATQTVRRRGGSRRQLYALILERSDGVSLVIAHPIDAIEWLGGGISPTRTTSESATRLRRCRTCRRGDRVSRDQRSRLQQPSRPRPQPGGAPSLSQSGVTAPEWRAPPAPPPDLCR